ncbi:hypothetical protein [Rhizobium sp. NLR22b]|uniref:hypothetical protein n=1 Tax=Rhizobium sp. NLR22b TaxID=2731115 RepID=UPI001C8359E2|nr:hypothetical protein [Rhizobium sp. NLR22b]MBX5240959.1 hypothetical protein [Rhizobium sp. NLR22b]
MIALNALPEAVAAAPAGEGMPIAKSTFQKRTIIMPNRDLKAVEVMGRKAFNSFLFEIYGDRATDSVKPDIALQGDGIYRVEVFNSPEGIIAAAHELHRVHVARLTPEPDFVDMTPADKAIIKGAAR